MKTSAPFWVGFGALALAVGCATSTIDSTGDQTSGTDPAASSDEGGTGDEGGGGGLGGGGGGGGGATDAGKSSSKDAGSSSKDAGTTTGVDAATSSSSGAVPTTCTEADGQIGCCDPSGVLYYCTSASKLTMQACTGGNVCGWSSKGYYDCVPSPGGADPSGTSPMACGGSSSSGGTDAGTPTTDAGSATVTWTTIYTTMFGPSGTSTCSGSGCHSSSQSGFTCGSTKTTCYNGLVSAGYITPGANASSSALVDPAQSPLCGTLGGNMPIGHSCVTAAQIKTIKTWLAAGAANN